MAKVRALFWQIMVPVLRTGIPLLSVVEVLQKSVLSKQDRIIVKEADTSTKVAWEEESAAKQAWEEAERTEGDEEHEDDTPLPDLRDLSDTASEEEEERKIPVLLASKVS